MTAINLTEMDREGVIRKVVEMGGDGVLKCIQCGACASVCPLGHAGFALHCKQLIRKLQTGHMEEILDEASTWACVACNQCTEVCPRDVRPSEVVFAFRRIQGNELAFFTPASISQMNLYQTGHAVMSKGSQELRRKVGLPDDPPTSICNEAAIGEIQTLLDNSTMAELGIF